MMLPPRMSDYWTIMWSTFLHIMFIIIFCRTHYSVSSLKVDGFSEMSFFVGERAKLPCNTSEWTSDVSLIIWYKGLSGKPLGSLDTRNVPSSRSSSLLSLSSSSFSSQASSSPPVPSSASASSSFSSPFSPSTSTASGRSSSSVSLRLSASSTSSATLSSPSSGGSSRSRSTAGSIEQDGIIKSPLSASSSTSSSSRPLVTGGRRTFNQNDRHTSVDKNGIAFQSDAGDGPESSYGKYYFDTSVQPPLFVIDSVTEDDAADYRCRIDYRVARTRNHVVRLNVIVPPEEVIITNDKEQRVAQIVGPLEEGSDLRLSCDAYGKPTPSVTWWLANDILLDDSYFSMSNGYIRNQLVLESMNRSILMKELTCRASNTNYTHYKEQTVLVDLNLRPLEIALVGAGKPISAGRQVAFECRTLGSRPRPIISWWLDAIKLAPISETNSVDGNMTTDRAVFTFKPSHNGKFFSCRADNPNLEDSSNSVEDGVMIAVHYLPSLKLTYGPNIKPENIREGFDVYLECHISANPRVYETVWLFEGKPLTSDPVRRIIIANQSLVLQNVSESSRGNYQCTARNDEGQGTSNRIFLRIQFIPTCKTMRKHPMAIAKTEKAQIACEVNSDPENVTFKWFLNNSSDIVEISSPIISNGTFSSISYSPKNRYGYGTLLCLAENSVGKQKEPCVFHIIPAGPPQPVTGCFLGNHSMTSILVNCDRGDDGGLPQTFVLEVHEVNSGEQLYNTSTNEKPIFMLNRLPPGTTLRFNVYALNGKGQSASVSLIGTTVGSPERQTSASLDNSPNYDWLLWPLLIVLSLTIITIMAGLVIKFFGTKRSRRSQKSKQLGEKNQDFNEEGYERSFALQDMDLVDGLTTCKEKKCQLICTTNDDDVVSVGYKNPIWPSNEDKSSPRIISTAFKQGFGCVGYPSSTSVLLKTTIHDMNTNHGVIDHSVDVSESRCLTGLTRYATETANMVDEGGLVSGDPKILTQNFDEIMMVREPGTMISTEYNTNCDAIGYSFTGIYSYNERDLKNSRDIPI
ncbi:uncharacterized protein LOC141854281 [Brevipalpus obovatus]|uniref:uncharacterized protein LOC141854281 n=1 Tax=Brevipalpus obovatus TaxID=246614 RepID=UPI003D9E7D88